MSAIAEKTGTNARGGKYLTFGLGTEEYGLEILKVREIIGLMDITAVPGTPPHVRGVINLRGQVIAVIDLRSRFGLPPVERTEQTCVIVVEINSEGRRISMGIVVDRVSEVLSIPASNIEDTPSFGANIDTSFVLGMGKIGSHVKILLDIDRVLGRDDINAISAINQGK
ncbi:MAG: chemotaxis protein CheW [Tepidisphaeraceae bacterium]|jgi:purine-binding chemotaxis protein CheW